MLLLCVFMLYLQGHYSFLVPQQRWFTTCRSGCLCRRMNKSLWEKKNHLHWLPNHLNQSVHSSLITVSIVQFTSLVAQNANALQESLVRAEAYMVCIHVCNSKTNRMYLHGNNTRGQRKNRRRVDRVFGRDRQMSISRCFLPSHYNTGRTWTEIKLNQVGCIKCSSLAWLVELLEFEFSTWRPCTTWDSVSHLRYL